LHVSLSYKKDTTSNMQQGH